MAFFSDPLTFKIAGMTGVLAVLLGSLIAGIFYRGKDGERYSPLNHFISELGEEGVSAKAGWFNLSLIVSGLCLLVACISLGLILLGTLARIAGVIGALCALSLALVGLFPLNLYKQHAASAMAFFRAGLAMLILFTFVIITQPEGAERISRFYGLAGLPGIAAFVYFLALAVQRNKQSKALEAPAESARPRVSRISIAEWAIFLSLVLWFAVLAIAL